MAKHLKGFRKIGIFLLFQLSQHYKREDYGLNRDDGLAIFKNKNDQQMEKIKKHFVRIFKSNSFLISIKCNMKIVNYLDVTLDLNGNSFRPYSKYDNELSYINCDSKHPPSVAKRPRTVELRLSSNSSNEVIFKNATSPYEVALKISGYKCKLNYKPQVAMTKKRKRKRNIIWLNPPFSMYCIIYQYVLYIIYQYVQYCIIYQYVFRM